MRRRTLKSSCAEANRMQFEYTSYCTEPIGLLETQTVLDSCTLIGLYLAETHVVKLQL